MSSQGFCFNFEGSDSGYVPVPPSGTTIVAPTACKTDDATAVSVLQLPVYSLTLQLLREWKKQNSMGTFEEIKLKYGANPTHLFSLFYQRAPSLAGLTLTDNNKQQDIIPGKYYGGLKIWSCAPYLVEYILTNQNVFKDLCLTNERISGEGLPPLQSSSLFGDAVVIEIGCGQGLPGIAALLLGARHVIFQDYNKEVLDFCVKPNIAANLEHLVSDDQFPSCGFLIPPNVQFVFGDWSQIKWQEGVKVAQEKGLEMRRNILLGSDVTFDEEACQKVAALLQCCLFNRNSVAYIASKRYYFGTHGGVLEFQRCAESYGLEVEEVSRNDDVEGMQRLIMRIKRRD